MKKCTLVVEDQVNVYFKDLEPAVRRSCNAAQKHFKQYARHTPAFKLGRWDGTVSFFAIAGSTYLNIIDQVLPIIMDAGYEVDIDDQRPTYDFNFPEIYEDFISDYAPNPVWPKGHDAEGMPIKLRDYQVEIINTFLQNPQCVQEVATGAGKTLMTATLSFSCEEYGRTMVIVPNRSLVTQTEKDYKNIGLDVGVFYGSRKEFGHKHTICTWQSLDNLAQGKASAGGTLEEFLKDMVCLMVDEAHSAKADVLQKMLCGPFAQIPIRWGLTGTIPKEEYDAKSLLVSIGPVVNKLRAKELQDRGVLANCHVNVCQLQDVVEFESFADEANFLLTDPNHLEWLSGFVKNLSQSGNTLVLVNRIETGEYLAANLPNSSFIYGNTKSIDRDNTYSNVSSINDALIIATYGVAAVGINIPRIFNLVLLEPGKSFVRVIQSIGRGIRKARDKDAVSIFDIASSCKFSAKHLTARKKYYKEQEYPFTIKKIDYLTELSASRSQQ